MKKILVISLLLIGIFMFCGCTKNNTQLPNPAAVKCEEDGYIYEIREDNSGGQYGVCIFDNGSECNGWAYFRGECGLDFECGSDDHCVPAQCCHPTSCVPISQAHDCSGLMCSQECVPGTMDCGQGSCVCVKGECQVEWSISIEKYCENDDDCTIQSTDNCCGREAINKNYYEHIPQICTAVCSEYTTKCENNICVLVSLD